MFFKRLKFLCEAKNIKITNLIKELDMSSGILSKWKSGDIPKADTLIKISDYFNISIDYLLGKTDDPTPPNKKDPPENENQEGQAIYDALVEIGAINKGDKITDKQVDALLKYFTNNKDYIRFLLDKNK